LALIGLVFHQISSCDLNCVSNRREEIWKFVQIHTVIIVFRIGA